ncbi:transposase family protein [Kitasatospora sp. MAP5-34]|uniref:transposase family protein n=1 Tax=Kitasatospora sp. MAP5-34 TaxID=3035102 RepID=UPI0024767109|nr:transposase family protein [Kitasatospora sp. MAP5-34]MDH6580725.1 putative transposase [Kitasatospora sp. MAP5-34]
MTRSSRPSRVPQKSASALVSREGTVSRLMALDGHGELATVHVRLAATASGVSERTVWNWLAAARTQGRLTAQARGTVVVTPRLRALLALWGGNVAAVHRHLVAEATSDPTATVPSLRALQRAVMRELTAGERAGLRGGENARRRHDVFGQRPRQWRNACWEGDHKRAPVRVDVEGTPQCPWITWFIDCTTKAITGVAVTPHQPSRDAVLAALRTGISREEPFGPFGGLPELVRVDRGKEFLCRTVTSALGALAVPVHDLPAYTPHLKGTIEQLNDAVEEMLLVSLPGYTRRARPAGTPRTSEQEELLPFAAFVQCLLDWVHWWNTEHHPAGLGGHLTPLQAWQADPTPVEDVSQQHLVLFALEDDGRVRVITTSGVTWRRRAYYAPWMVGRTGTKVRLRHLPHHDAQIEVFDAADPTRHLCTAYLADPASEEQRKALRAARQAAARALKADLKAAERLRRDRYSAATTPAAPQPRDALTAAEAQEQIARTNHKDLAARALPDLIPPREPPTSWARPVRCPRPAPAADEAARAAQPAAPPDAVPSPDDPTTGRHS